MRLLNDGNNEMKNILSILIHSKTSFALNINTYSSTLIK
jgi:hypothetical protein